MKSMVQDRIHIILSHDPSCSEIFTLESTSLCLWVVRTFYNGMLFNLEVSQRKVSILKTPCCKSKSTFTIEESYLWFFIVDPCRPTDGPEITFSGLQKVCSPVNNNSKSLFLNKSRPYEEWVNTYTCKIHIETRY